MTRCRPSTSSSAVEGAAEHRRDAQHRKELRRHPLRPRVRRLAPFGLQPELRAADRRERLKGLLHLPPVQVGLRRDVAFAERHRVLRVLLHHHAEPVVLVERQPAEDDRVDDGEDGGAGADAQRQHRQRDDREAAGVAQGAERGLEIVSHGRLDVEPAAGLA